MSIDIASLAAAVATGVSGVAVAAAGAEITRRARRMEVGQVTIKWHRERLAHVEEVDWRHRAVDLLAGLDDISATEYALDAATRERIDTEIDRAIEGLERRSDQRPR